MRHLVLPSLVAITLGSLMATACSSSSDKNAATAGPSGTTTTTGTGTGTGGGGGQGTGGSGQTGGAGHGGNTTGTGGQNAGGGNGGAAGGGGEGGNGTDCTVPAFCPGVDELCRFRICVEGKCGMTNAGAGAPAGPPDPGTCTTRICDGNGGITTLPDDNNLPVDGNPCTLDTCDKGVPSNPAAPKGTICNSLGTPKYCDDKGVCVECNANVECNGGTCKAGLCDGSSPCNDVKKNGNETDVDCGGGVCPVCEVQHTCKVAADCATNICTNGVCQSPAATCNDGKKNQDETDVDCGGTTCGPCDALKQCAGPDDCKSALCLGAVTKHCIAKVTLNGCDITTAENHIGENKIQFSFGGGVGNKYQPACVIVAPGTQLSFAGDFSMHPLQGGTVTNGVGKPEAQSIFQLTQFGFVQTYTPSLPTNYGYYCTTHVAAGMMGAIFVVP